MKKEFAFILVVLLLCSIFSSFGITTYAYDSSGASVIGEIKLPDSLKSAVNLEVDIELYNIYDVTAYQYTVTTIAAGSNSAFYYFEGITPQNGYCISYSLNDSSTYFPKGYYNSIRTTVNENDAEYIDLTYMDLLNGDMTLIKNDTSAPNLINNQSYTGNLSSESDVNYFRFTPDVTQNYFIESTGDLDTYCDILDSNLNEVYGASNDDINIEKLWVNFRVFTELEAGETYYIKVKCNSWLTFGNYGIKVSKSDVSSLDTNLSVRSTKLTDNNNNPVNSLTASGTVNSTVKVTNITDTTQKGTLIMILYNGNKQESIKTVQKDVEPGDTVDFTSSLNLPNSVTEKTLRVYLWNNLNVMNPLSKIIYNIN